jgi:hypothetical protein
VSHACPCPFPHAAMVSEVALRKAAHALAFTALHVINAHICASRRERRYGAAIDTRSLRTYHAPWKKKDAVAA